MSIETPMIIAEQRRINARELLKQCDSNRDFAARVKISGAQVTHLLGPHPTFNIGDTIARRIEKGFNKPDYWLDMDHTVELGDDNVTIELMLEAVRVLNETLKKNKMQIDNIDQTLYNDILRHIIYTAIPLGKVSPSQIQSTLTLSRVSKIAN
jgi:predicted amino acid-binding ACT domain protein